MDKKKERMIKYLEAHKKDAEKNNRVVTTLILSKNDIDYLINNLKAVDKLENEIKTMIIERLTETCNKIDSLKQEVVNTDITTANIINPLNLKMRRFDRGLY